LHTFAGLHASNEYDRNNRLSSTDKGSGQKIVLRRDAAGQVIERHHPSGNVDRFEYDRHGWVVRAKNHVSEVELQRDARGRVRREVQSAGGWRFEVEHLLDALGAEIATRYSTGWGKSFERGAGAAELKLFMQDGSRETVRFDYDAEDCEVRRAWSSGKGGIIA